MTDKSVSKEKGDGEPTATPEKSRAERLRTDPGEVGKEDAIAIFRDTASGIVAQGGTLAKHGQNEQDMALDRFSTRLGDGKGIEGCRIPMSWKVFKVIQPNFDSYRDQLMLRREVSRIFRVSLEHKEMEIKLNIAGHRIVENVECAVLEVEHMKYDSEMSRLEANAVLNILKQQLVDRMHEVEKRPPQPEPDPNVFRIRASPTGEDLY